MLLQLVKWGFRITYISNTFVLPLNAFESKIKKSIKPFGPFNSNLNFFQERHPSYIRLKKEKYLYYLFFTKDI